MKKARLSVLVPVRTAGPELIGAHREAAAAIDRLGLDCEFLYLVDPKSAPAIEKLQESEGAGRIRMVQVGHSVGEAPMLSAGIAEAEGEILLILPPCYEVESEAIGQLYEALQSGADLAFASRGPREGASARLQSRLFNRLISWAAGTHFTDITTGTRAIRRDVLREVPLYGDFHRYLPALAERVGFSVREIAAREHPNATSTRYRPSDYLWRALDVLSIFFLSRFTRHPLRLFGGLGSVFGGVGAVILAVVSFQRVFLGQGLAERPILVISTLLFGLGVQLLTIGLLGELILFFHARGIRDYRIAEVHETPSQALPEPREPVDGPGSAD